VSAAVEINFDGLVGPSHNYAGLSPGNLAATAHAGAASAPRRAALEGLDKMRACLRLGLRQGFLLPHARPNRDWLGSLGTDWAGATPHLRARAFSASPMWAANAATVSPAVDARDGRCHLSVANLLTMPHRAHEWPETLAQLRLIFAGPQFAVHPPVPAPFGDEGAANHMRLSAAPDAPGVEVFVYAESGGPFPARQHREASEAVARRHGLDAGRTLFVRQDPRAVAAGAFHNDVVAVANGPVLLAHEHAFAEPDALFAWLAERVPGFVPLIVPDAAVPLADAIASYLFNAQLVDLPDGEGMALVLPAEARENAPTRAWLETLVRGNGPVRHLEWADVRQSMANGGGPACLRLRVVADPDAVDPRFLADEATLDRIAAVVDCCWPERIAPNDLADPTLVTRIEAARVALFDAVGVSPLYK